MSCCGGERRRAGGTVGPAGPEPIPPAVEPAGARIHVLFEYVGPTGLTAYGAATGRRYRFEGPGSRVTVHPRDRPSLAMVPRLRQVN